MRLGIRPKLVLLSLLILVVISFGFTALHLAISSGWLEEDLRERAITFAREFAATIGDRHEFESRSLLAAQIAAIMAVRPNVLQLDVLAFEPDNVARVVATSSAGARLPFTRRDATDVRRGRVLSRLIDHERTRSWEVMAPIELDGQVAGAVAAKFSLDRADALRGRIALWALGLTAVSTVVMGLLMGGAIQVVVTRRLRRFLDAVERIRQGDTQATVAVSGGDELGVLARHFNAMMSRIGRFSEELQARVIEATAELDHRYQEVQRLNETLFRLQRDLSHAERLALAGRMMAEVAHEVGTPLHSVAGHLELLRKDLPSGLGGGEPGRRLAIIETQLQRVIEIISRLLEVTRRDAGAAAPVDVERLVTETAELVRPALTASGLALAITAEPALPPVHGFPTQLQQVLLNLLTNAIDASPPGTHIAVTVGARAAGREIEVTIRDAGPGIPAEQRKRIFEPFFSTKPPGKGTGLGLFIATKIVEDHRGRLEVESAPGAGAAFRLVLPAGAPAR
jgi:signal transduction histidine kinase